MTQSDEVGFAICPVCSKRTAAHLFREIKRRQICFFCAQRAEKTEAEALALKEDHRYHSLSGNIGKYLLRVAAGTIVMIILRMALIHYLLSQGQQ